MPIVSGGQTGTTRGGGGAAANATATAPVYLEAARAAIQNAIRKWIREAVVRGEVTGAFAHLKPGCLTSNSPIEAPVRDAMITSGAPALLAVAVAHFIDSNWQSWASQLRATLIAFPEFEQFVPASANRWPSVALGFPLSTLQSPGNALFAYSTFPAQLKEVAAPYFPAAGPQTRNAAQQTQALSMSAPSGAAGFSATTSGQPLPRTFGAVLQQGSTPLDQFAGLGDWLSASFDHWFLGAGIGRLFGTGIGIPLALNCPPHKIIGTCDGSLRCLRLFGERA
jgi:hypothetical protein